MDFKFSCMILAGGMSSRMHGINKAFVKLGDQSLISKIINNIPHQHITTAINANKDLNEFYKFGLETIKDDIGKNYGPLSGIYTALNWANKLKFKWVLTIPCDIPFFPGDFFLKANYLLDDKLKNLSKIYNDCKPNINNCSNNQDFVIKKAYGKMILIKIKN